MTSTDEEVSTTKSTEPRTFPKVKNINSLFHKKKLRAPKEALGLSKNRTTLSTSNASFKDLINDLNNMFTLISRDTSSREYLNISSQIGLISEAKNALLSKLPLLEASMENHLHPLNEKQVTEANKTISNFSNFLSQLQSILRSSFEQVEMYILSNSLKNAKIAEFLSSKLADIGQIISYNDQLIQVVSTGETNSVNLSKSLKLAEVKLESKLYEIDILKEEMAILRESRDEIFEALKKSRSNHSESDSESIKEDLNEIEIERTKSASLQAIIDKLKLEKTHGIILNENTTQCNTIYQSDEEYNTEKFENFLNESLITSNKLFDQKEIIRDLNLELTDVKTKFQQVSIDYEDLVPIYQELLREKDSLIEEIGTSKTKLKETEIILEEISKKNNDTNVEMANLSEEMKIINSEKDQLTSSLEIAQNKISEIKNNLESSQNANVTLTETERALRLEYEELKNNFHSSESTIIDLQNQLNNFKKIEKDLTDYKSKFESISNENSQLRINLTETTNSLKSLEKSSNKNEKEYAKILAKYEVTSTDLGNLKNENAALSKQVQSEQNEHQKTFKAYETEKAGREQASNELAELKKNVSGKDKEVKTSSDQVEKIEKLYTDCQNQNVELKASNTQLTTELSSLQKLNDKLNIEIQKLKDSVENAKEIETRESHHLDKIHRLEESNRVEVSKSQNLTEILENKNGEILKITDRMKKIEDARKTMLADLTNMTRDKKLIEKVNLELNDKIMKIQEDFKDEIELKNEEINTLKEENEKMTIEKETIFREKEKIGIEKEKIGVEKEKLADEKIRKENQDKKVVESVIHDDDDGEWQTVGKQKH